MHSRWRKTIVAALCHLQTLSVFLLAHHDSWGAGQTLRKTVIIQEIAVVYLHQLGAMSNTGNQRRSTALHFWFCSMAHASTV